MNKNLEEMEVILERFKVVESFPNSPLSVTDIQLDGKSIGIEGIVKIANQLASALNDRGCYFEVKSNDTN